MKTYKKEKDNSTLVLDIKTLTPLWIGDAYGTFSSIKESSIIGSVRWWYEGIVRGMGGYVCDTTSAHQCKFDQDAYSKKYNNCINSGHDRKSSLKHALDAGLENVCYTCRLFGCSGWKRRFKLIIKDVTSTFQDSKKGFKGTFTIEIIDLYNNEILFTNNQKWLLSNTFNIIEKYGAIGGKNTLKPQKGIIGQDYGLFVINNNNIKDWNALSSYDNVKLEIQKILLQHENECQYFNFKYYWIVEGIYLDRLKLNKITGLSEKGKVQKNDDFLKFIRGDEGISKKIYSFSKPAKIFGYVRNQDEIKKIKSLIELFVPIVNFKTGNDILENMGDF